MIINKFSFTILVVLFSSAFSTFSFGKLNFPSLSNIPSTIDVENDCQCQCHQNDDEDEISNNQFAPFIQKSIFQNNCKILQLNGKQVKISANINQNSIIVDYFTQMKFTYSISENKISFNIASPINARLNPLQSQLQRAFLSAITFEINGNRFLLKDVNGKIVIIFEKLIRNDLIKNYDFNQVNIVPKTQTPVGLKYVDTARGRVGIIKLSDPVPKGWKLLQLNVGKQISQQLKPLLQYWSIVAFDQGKIAGAGYNYQIQDTYGPQAGQKFITEIC